MLEITLSVLILIGAGFTFIGSLGLARMPDFYSRLHGPTKATTIGVGSLLIASMIHFSTQDAGLSFHEVLVTLFLFITAPVSAHLLSKAALHLGTRSLSEPPSLVDAADRDALTNGEPRPHPSPAPRPSARPRP
jgi:multicomponent K+:H+ antiporter subunit G